MQKLSNLVFYIQERQDKLTMPFLFLFSNLKFRFLADLDGFSTDEDDESWWEALSSLSDCNSSSLASPSQEDDFSSSDDSVDAPTYDHLPSDESFFQVLIEETLDEKSFVGCSGDHAHEGNCFAAELDEFLGGTDFNGRAESRYLETFLRDREEDEDRKDATLLDELLLADFYQPLTIAAFLTNLSMRVSTKNPTSLH
jgi:hypothetical protein